MTANLLAGPILRRTTVNRVCVWLATRTPLQLRLTVMDAEGNKLGQSKLNPQGSVLDKMDGQCVQLGASLYVYLLQVRRDGGLFPFDQLLYYRLDEVGENDRANPLDLKDLAYGGEYPSFFIPSKLKNLLHGSCRKPHGSDTDPDALSHGEALLRENYRNIDQRPALLLLTGDQIYADDVAIPLAAMLREKALELIGRQELLPLPPDEATGQRRTLDPLKEIALYGRKDELNKYRSGLSSGESENHLLTFGEYAAMYLYVFGNGEGWGIKEWNDWKRLKDLCPKGIKNDEAHLAFDAQEKALNNFNETVPQVRKLLANIPTYMIFDDHDVTDDWNITGGWYENVRRSPLGRRVVSNALAAYWAFQGWGNDPDNFNKDLVWSILRRLQDGGNDPDIAERYDLHTWKARGWGFSIPTSPPIIAMDSRTQRQYDAPDKPSRLMDRYALDWLRVEWIKLKTDLGLTKDTWPVIISPTPVIGAQFIEKLQTLLSRLFGVNRLDAETWSANRDGFKALFEYLRNRMELSSCVFLSGDVHYAFSAKGTFVNIQGSNDFTCLQLTSSATCNVPVKGNRKIVEKLMEEIEQIVDRTTIITSDLLWFGREWSASMELLPANGKEKPIMTGCNLGLVEFASGRPIAHTLLHKDGKIVFKL